jgi:hypothetical protein
VRLFSQLSTIFYLATPHHLTILDHIKCLLFRLISLAID